MNISARVQNLIHEAQRIALICHIIPDGDAVGSLLGLGLALRILGKECILVCQDAIPEEFFFLPSAAEVRSTLPQTLDLIITLDSSDTQRLGSAYDAALFQAKPVINIDHHVTNVRFGSENWVEPMAATAEICLALICGLGIPVDPMVATCLLTGIVTDTRCFRTPNVTTAVLRTVINLMDMGASLPQITAQVFRRNSPERICLWSKALATVQTQDGIIWAEVSREMMESCRADTRAAEGLVSFLDTTREAKVSIVFREAENGEVETSMRSIQDVDISGVAFALGGGGHPQAAGCTCPGTLEGIRERVLAAVAQALQTQDQTIAGTYAE